MHSEQFESPDTDAGGLQFGIAPPLPDRRPGLALPVPFLIAALACFAMATLIVIVAALGGGGGTSASNADTSASAIALAKSQAATADQAMRECGRRNGSVYDGCTANELRKLEPALADSTQLSATSTLTGYTVTVTSGDQRFSVVREGAQSSRRCSSPGGSGCPPSGTW